MTGLRGRPALAVIVAEADRQVDPLEGRGIGEEKAIPIARDCIGEILRAALTLRAIDRDRIAERELVLILAPGLGEALGSGEVLL